MSNQLPPVDLEALKSVRLMVYDAEGNPFPSAIADRLRHAAVAEIRELREREAEHCACTHDGRGNFTNECQEHSFLYTEAHTQMERVFSDLAGGEAPEDILKRFEAHERKPLYMNLIINALRTVTKKCQQHSSLRTSLSQKVTGETSDGYHTFNELYEHRHALFSVLCRTFGGWKSRLHADGTMFDGWFIAGIQAPAGQITYHLPESWWPIFICPELPNAPEWDGHTPADVIFRVRSLGTTEKVLYDDEVGSITWSAFSPHIWIPKEVADAFGKPNTRLRVRVVESPVTEEKER